MLAHSSPTLIAACHVLHRLYAPRHPRIALTSRLRVHTTNDNTGSSLRMTRNSAEQCRVVFRPPSKQYLDGNAKSVRMILLSLELVRIPVCQSTQPVPLAQVVQMSRNRIPHGIDLKTHSQCQIGVACGPTHHHGFTPRRTVSLHL